MDIFTFPIHIKEFLVGETSVSKALMLLQVLWVVIPNGRVPDTLFHLQGSSLWVSDNYKKRITLNIKV